MRRGRRRHGRRARRRVRARRALNGLALADDCHDAWSVAAAWPQPADLVTSTSAVLADGAKRDWLLSWKRRHFAAVARARRRRRGHRAGAQPRGRAAAPLVCDHTTAAVRLATSSAGGATGLALLTAEAHALVSSALLTRSVLLDGQPTIVTARARRGRGRGTCLAVETNSHTTCSSAGPVGRARGTR